MLAVSFLVHYERSGMINGPLSFHNEENLLKL